MALELHNTENPISNLERLKINENWQRIISGYAYLQRQINILAGNQEVGELLQRIEDAINNAYTSVAAAIEENNVATQEAINNVNTSLEIVLDKISVAIQEINLAITTANKATADAKKATSNANTAIQVVNDKVTEATQLFDSLDALKTQMELLKQQLETAKTDTETATSNANSAAQEVRNAIQDTNTAIANAEGATQKANQAVQDINEAKEDLTQVVNDKITEADTAITNANNATDQADQAAEAIKGWGTATVWNETTQYEKNNIVTDNGSSWQATKANANSKPTNTNTDWIMLAQRGVDGKGAVSSVNNVLPDEKGNVQLNIKQGTVQKVNGKSPDNSGEVTLVPEDIDAETPQGAQDKVDLLKHFVTGHGVGDYLEFKDEQDLLTLKESGTYAIYISGMTIPEDYYTVIASCIEEKDKYVSLLAISQEGAKVYARTFYRTLDGDEVKNDTGWVKSGADEINAYDNNIYTQPLPLPSEYINTPKYPVGTSVFRGDSDWGVSMGMGLDYARSAVVETIKIPNGKGGTWYTGKQTVTVLEAATEKVIAVKSRVAANGKFGEWY
ncbi:hypothetical protein [Lysinibacillus sp. RC79]|uniref:hypothetical protein n=1 Tax=Lysinibacillus sp. RC79 TaxID=3156296 RepID=UPI003513F5DC